MMIGDITLGNITIPYTISYTDRKTLAIKVLPNSEVHLIAPIGASIEEIESKLRLRASWILKQQRYFTEFGDRTPPKKYVSGESHYYLGKQYILRVTESNPDSAKYKGRCFEVVCTPKSKAKELMKEWYRERAKVKFLEIAEGVNAKFKKYDVTFSSLHIQEMDSRWGSCTSKGKIILNTELIKAPKLCIEYVITHEFCHLVHRGHTKKFYALLEKEMPDWKRWKDKLERFMV